MKKLVCLFLVSFMALAIISCSSDDKEEPAVGCELHYLMSDEEAFQYVQDGDTVFIHTAVDAELGYVTTDLLAATTIDRDDLDSLTYKWLYRETMPVEGVNFHWITIKQESPTGYMFIVNCKKEHEPEMIWVRMVPSSGIYKTNLWAAFTLE